MLSELGNNISNLRLLACKKVTPQQERMLEFPIHQVKVIFQRSVDRFH